MYQFPIRIPQGWKLTVTQQFKSPEMIQFYKSKGINVPYHEGVDVVCGDGQQTFGSACVWPFPFPGTVFDAAVDAPMGATAHAHSQVDGIDPVTGISYSLLYIHLTEVSKSKTFNQGDVVGWIGNNGAVFPQPTPSAPFNGAHLHLGLGIKRPSDLNYIMSNPEEYFDVTNPFRGADDPSKDIPVFNWAKANGATVEQTPYEKLVELGNSMMSTNPIQARIVLAVAQLVKSFS